MYCSKCGKEISDDSVFCQHCGCPIKSKIIKNSDDKPLAILNAVGFFVPLAGLIMNRIIRKSKPLRAQLIGAFSLAGLVLQILLVVFFSI